MSDKTITGTALCLTGGGITGAVYEVGVLAALEDTFESFEACDFEVFIGAASGAVVATALAGGISAQRLYRALLDPADDFFPLQRNHLLRFDSREILRVATSIAGAFRRLLGSVASKPLDVDLWNEIDRFYDSLPAGLFTTDPFEKFLDEVLQRRGIDKNFDELPRKLCVIANDLDRGQRVVFGSDSELRPSVPKAVAAACAVPMLYAPVRIAERDFIGANAGESGHVDVAEELGCNVVLLINPMVPVQTDVFTKDIPTGHGKKRRVRDKGLLWVYNQSWRLVTEARLQRGLENYRKSHPNIDVHLLEPDRADATMFMHSPMNFAARRAILESAYTSTMHTLRDPSSDIRRMFSDKGLKPKD